MCTDGWPFPDSYYWTHWCEVPIIWRFQFLGIGGMYGGETSCSLGNVSDIEDIIVLMMTSSNGNIFRVTGPLCGEFTGPGEFPTQRQVTRSFDVFFDLRLNKWLSRQPWGWWFETPSWSLWRQCNGSAFSTKWRPPRYPSNVSIKRLKMVVKSNTADRMTFIRYNWKIQINTKLSDAVIR